MPWKEFSVEEERMKFVVAWNQGGWNFSDLCRNFGISRTTGYKYLERYNHEGIDGLKNKSRAPIRRPKSTREKLVELIVDARRAHPSWGPITLLAALRGRFPTIRDWPAASTVGEILKREGLIKPRRRRKRTPQTLFPFSNAGKPNDLWCADFKGHFTVGNRLRCNPLTVSDACSRYLLKCQSLLKQDAEHTIPEFERVFREYGLPYAIRTDNGPPFASRGLGGLSLMSVWWLKLGIRHERIQPGKPYQNGRHERMHLTLKQATALPPRSSIAAQQAAFDAFRKEYNEERPHRALDLKRPADIYRSSPRAYPEIIPEIDYPTNMEIQKVDDDGTIYYGSHRVYLAGLLRGEFVGIEEMSERYRRIYFASAIVTILDAYTGKLLNYKSPLDILEI